MWLLPLFPSLAISASHVYYRLTFAGGRVPATGPVLLVANHPNSLFDPVLVQAATPRPVRFLAKAPLFTDRLVGWLVRGSGSIPAYRRIDDPAQVARNEDTFRAVYAALGAGAAVGVFPEGLSHSAPALAPLRTGAARMALGAFTAAGRAFPIVPIGLVLRQKDIFRSEALVLVGEPVEWDDLAPRGVEDAEAVRELTARIDAGLRRVTVNLEQWEDQPLAECAVRIWEASRGAAPAPAERVARLEITTRLLAVVRETADPAGLELAREVQAHCARLARLRLRPSDVLAEVPWGRGFAWGARRLPLVLPLGAAIAIAGFLVFFPPYRLTGWVAGLFRQEHDQRATHKLLVGIVAYALWVILLAILTGVRFGPLFAPLVLAGTPLVGMAGLLVRERWRGSWRDARRFFLLRSRRALVDQLAARQRALADRLHALYEAHTATGDPT